MNDDELRDDESPDGAAHRRELLGVEPLDEVTRRRLLRTALDAAPAPAKAPPRTRWLAAAAALVVVLAVGGAVVASLGGGNETTTDMSEAPASEQGRETSELDASRAEPRPATPVPLGDLGTATRAEALAARAERGYTQGAAADARQVACLDHLQPALAVASGAVGDRALTVLVYADRVVVADATTCALVADVPRPIP